MISNVHTSTAVVSTRKAQNHQRLWRDSMPPDASTDLACKGDAKQSKKDLQHPGEETTLVLNETLFGGGWSATSTVVTELGVAQQ